MDGLTDDDSFIGYLSVPWSIHDGLDIGDPGIAVGWSAVAVVFSDMFEPKSSLRFNPPPHDKDDDREWSMDTARLIELTRERNTAPDPALMRELDAGRRLQIVDYGSLLVDDPKLLEIGSADREDRTTD